MLATVTRRAIAATRLGKPMHAQHAPKRMLSGCCHWFDPVPSEAGGGESVWQVDSNRVAFGRGVLSEAGAHARRLGMTRVAIFTDAGVADCDFVHTLTLSLAAAQVEYTLYKDVRVEPTDTSIHDAIAFAREGLFNGYISLGGGSVIDTCKAANLYASQPPPDGDFLAYVNKPIGQGLEPQGELSPHIACPTTAGTGSEATGIAIFDLTAMHAKTGIALRAIRPSVALVDPDVMSSLPANVVAAAGFDVLSHACESLTAKPFTRAPRAVSPDARPMSQGSNPWSDIGAARALELTGQYLVRAVHSAEDVEAREGMLLASTLAGIAFGNAGCHIPHGLSYSVSGLVRDYCPSGYPDHHPIVPHGFSVILNAPSTFRFTGSACPDRHLNAAKLLGADTRGATDADAGELLASQIEHLMREAHVPSGLEEVGFTNADLPNLVEGAMPQARLLNNAPIVPTAEDVEGLYKSAMKYW